MILKSRCNQVALKDDEEVICWCLLSYRFTYTITCCASSRQTQHLQTLSHSLASKPSSVLSISGNSSAIHPPDIQTRSLGVSSWALFSHPQMPRFLADRIGICSYLIGICSGSDLAKSHDLNSGLLGWEVLGSQTLDTLHLLPVPQGSTWLVTCQT